MTQPFISPQTHAGAPLGKGQKLMGGARIKLGKDLKAQYEKGASVRDLAEATGRSYGFVHMILGEAGVVMRSRGGANRLPKPARRRSTTGVSAANYQAQNPRTGF